MPRDLEVTMKFLIQIAVIFSSLAANAGSVEIHGRVSPDIRIVGIVTQFHCHPLDEIITPCKMGYSGVVKTSGDNFSAKMDLRQKGQFTNHFLLVEHRPTGLTAELRLFNQPHISSPPNSLDLPCELRTIAPQGDGIKNQQLVCQTGVAIHYKKNLVYKNVDISASGFDSFVGASALQLASANRDVEVEIFENALGEIGLGSKINLRTADGVTREFFSVSKLDLFLGKPVMVLAKRDGLEVTLHLNILQSYQKPKYKCPTTNLGLRLVTNDKKGKPQEERICLF
jgi:hypothetical protein